MHTSSIVVVYILMDSLHKSCTLCLTFFPLKIYRPHVESWGFLTHISNYYPYMQRNIEDYTKRKVYGQTNKTVLSVFSGLISSLIFTIVRGTLIILFDAFATKFACMSASLIFNYSNQPCGQK